MNTNPNLRQIINHSAKSKIGNRITMQLANSETTEYQYDPIYQLTKETRRDKKGKIAYDIQFSYDEVGNRTKQVRDIKKGIGKKKGKDKPDFRDLPGLSGTGTHPIP